MHCFQANIPKWISGCAS